MQRFILLMLICTFLGAGTSSGQVRGLLRDRIREAMKEESEKEEKKTKEDTPGENDQVTPTSPFQRGLGDRMTRAMGMADLDFEDQYNFNSSMSMDVEVDDGETSEVSEIDYTLFYNEDDSSFAMQFSGVNQATGEYGQHLMIFDMKNYVMLMLSEADNEKTGLAFKFDPDTQAAGYEHEEIHKDENAYGEDYEIVIPEYRKTGKTKVIAGFSSDEYTWEDDSVRMDFWISPEAQFDYSRAWGYMGGLQSPATGKSELKGVIMEYLFIDKSTASRSKMIVREINPDSPRKFDVSEFQVVGFGSFPGKRN